MDIFYRKKYFSIKTFYNGEYKAKRFTKSLIEKKAAQNIKAGTQIKKQHVKIKRLKSFY